MTKKKKGKRCGRRVAPSKGAFALKKIHGKGEEKCSIPEKKKGSPRLEKEKNRALCGEKAL